MPWRPLLGLLARPLPAFLALRLVPWLWTQRPGPLAPSHRLLSLWPAPLLLLFLWPAPLLVLGPWLVPAWRAQPCCWCSSRSVASAPAPLGGAELLSGWTSWAGGGRAGAVLCGTALAGGGGACGTALAGGGGASSSSSSMVISPFALPLLAPLLHDLAALLPGHPLPLPLLVPVPLVFVLMLLPPLPFQLPPPLVHPDFAVAGSRSSGFPVDSKLGLSGSLLGGSTAAASTGDVVTAACSASPLLLPAAASASVASCWPAGPGRLSVAAVPWSASGAAPASSGSSGMSTPYLARNPLSHRAFMQKPLLTPNWLRARCFGRYSPLQLRHGWASRRLGCLYPLDCLQLAHCCPLQRRAFACRVSLVASRLGQGAQSSWALPASVATSASAPQCLSACCQLPGCSGACTAGSASCSAEVGVAGNG